MKRYFFPITLVIALAVIMRFFDYENRWGLAQDQAQFAILAREEWSFVTPRQVYDSTQKWFIEKNE